MWLQQRLGMSEEQTCIVWIYSFAVTRADWEIVSVFGGSGIKDLGTLQAAGWVGNHIAHARSTAQYSARNNTLIFLKTWQYWSQAWLRSDSRLVRRYELHQFNAS